MKHHHPAPVAPDPIHALQKNPASPRRAAKSRGPRPSESGDRPEQEIREIAYSIYEARGRGAGNELDDWLQAEALVIRRTAAAGTESPSTDNPQA